jgi:hypothetical protein
VEAVTPKEVDPEVAARVKRKWVARMPACLHACMPDRLGGRQTGWPVLLPAQEAVQRWAEAAAMLRLRLCLAAAAAAGTGPLGHALTRAPASAACCCSIEAGQRKRLDEKKKDSVKKAQRRQKSWD